MMCHLVAALVHQRLGQADAARTALREATEIKARRATREPDDWGELWQGWVICQVLTREVKALVEGGTTEPDK